MPFLQGERSEAPHEALFWRNGTNKAIRQGPLEPVLEPAQYVAVRPERRSWGGSESSRENVEELKSIYSEWEGGTAEPAWPARPGSRTVEVDGVLIDINI